MKKDCDTKKLPRNGAKSSQAKPAPIKPEAISTKDRIRTDTVIAVARGHLSEDSEKLTELLPQFPGDVERQAALEAVAKIMEKTEELLGLVVSGSANET